MPDSSTTPMDEMPYPAAARKPSYRNDEEMLNDVFRYHAPNEEQQHRYEKLRDVARYFARTVIENCPPCADRTAAIRKIREAVMTANAAIALGGRV